MKELKTVYEELGFLQVRTYIQSGNVLADHPKSDAKELSKRLEEKILQKYGFDVPVLVKPSDEMESVVTSNPFLQRKDVNLEYLHVTFLAEEPSQAAIDKLKTLNYAPDEFMISGKEVYLSCPNGYGRTKLTNTFFENKLKVTATTRNWRTVTTLAEMAKASS